MARRLLRTTIGQIAAVLIVVLLIGVVFLLLKPDFFSTRTIKEAEARSIAIATLQKQHAGTGEVLTDVTVLSADLIPAEVTGTVGTAWKVIVTANIVEPKGAHYPIYLWVDVDSHTGAAQIVAQG